MIVGMPKSVSKALPGKRLGTAGLSDKFWPRFVASWWGRKPAQFSRPLQKPLAAPETVFGELKRAAGASRDGERATDLRVYLDNLRVTTELERYLPHGRDRGVDQYLARVSRGAKHRGVGVVFNNYHRWDADAWLDGRDFLCGLFDAVGLPVGGATMDVFLGNYASTPFGIHKDTKHVFTWVLKGRKRILLWPFSTFVGRDLPDDVYAKQVALGSSDIRTARRSAIVLEGGEGDLLYWPPSYWHIAEAVRGSGAALTLTIGLEQFEDPQTVLLSRIRDAAVRRMSEAQHVAWIPRRSQGSTRDQRREVMRGLQAIFTTARSARFHKMATTTVLNWMTAAGFVGFPAQWRPQKSLLLSDRVCGDRRHPISWEPVGDQLMCSANGHHWTMRRRAQTLAALQTLNTGLEASVRDLLRRLTPRESADGRRLLVLLFALRWLRRCAS
jgi:hypothetical protein